MKQAQTVTHDVLQVDSEVASGRISRSGRQTNGLELLDAKQRKRIQNRIAQRTYRQAQKQRVQALEEVVAQAATCGGLISPVMEDVQLPAAGPPFEDENHWSTSNHTEPSGEDPFEHDHVIQQISPADGIWSGVPLHTDPPDRSRPALHRAAVLGSHSMCNLLLDKGAEISKHDGEGKTALHIAVESGNQTLLRMMLEKRDASVTDAFGRTALFLAVHKKNEELVKLLLDFQVNVNCRDVFGEVALHAAVENGLESIVSLLLEHGADVDA